MKRFHVHVHVRDLQANVDFYSRLFGAQPTRLESDYAKWMLDDPRLNFAISSRGDAPGIGHLGFQAETDEELVQLRTLADAADAAVRDEGATTCCYAHSDKHWVTDPQGVAWEQFRTTGDIATFREVEPAAQAGACCAPRGKPVGVPVRAAGCC